MPLRHAAGYAVAAAATVLPLLPQLTLRYAADTLRSPAITRMIHIATLFAADDTLML